MKTITYVGLAILPLFSSAHDQVKQTKAPIVEIAKKANIETNGVRRFCSPENAYDSFCQDVLERISRLEESASLLEIAIDKSLQDIENIRFSSDELSLLKKQVNKTISGIASAKKVISKSFESIMKDPELKDLSFAADLRDRALKGMDELMLTINKVVNLKDALESRQETVIVIDVNRMNVAMSSVKHSAPKGMTREERRKFILSRANA
ncbi:hypothetical protein [Providencia manganoxydans]|uniref:hypothetical protein n=1 Tax=Providencia manganoxydans TaxID=2923283 RepID=UPI0034DCE6CF